MCGIILFLLFPTQSIVAYADSEYAALKGFTVTGFNFSDDYDEELLNISDGGNMSLWAGYYSYYNSTTKKNYITILMEAKLCSYGDSGSTHYNNENMEIVITHKNYLDTDIVTYAPEQSTTTQYTVSKTIDAGITTDGFSLGYSYQTSSTLNDINYTFTDSNTSETYPTLSAKYNYAFSNYSNNSSNISPYVGEIVQGMSITYCVDYGSNPGWYNTDSETYKITYTGKIYSKSSGSKSNSISVRFVSGIAK